MGRKWPLLSPLLVPFPARTASHAMPSERAGSWLRFLGRRSFFLLEASRFMRLFDVDNGCVMKFNGLFDHVCSEESVMLNGLQRERKKVIEAMQSDAAGQVIVDLPRCTMIRGSLCPVLLFTFRFFFFSHRLHRQ